MNPIELGKFIAKLRNEKKLTQEELAEKLFIDKRKISRWECGTSMPEFDMLIKLSEILDISLYELSICKRIEKEGLTRRIINKFRNAKDYKKYESKKLIKNIIVLILILLFIITISFTIEHYNTIGIYEINSLDDKYYIEGNYIYAKDFTLFYIKKFYIKSNNISYRNCEYEIYNNEARVLYISSNNDKQTDLKLQNTYYETNNHKGIKNTANFKVKCTDKNNKTYNYNFNIKLNKLYGNRLLIFNQ